MISSQEERVLSSPLLLLSARDLRPSPLGSGMFRGWIGRTGLVGFFFPLPLVHLWDIRNEVFTAEGAAIWALLTICRPVWP